MTRDALDLAGRVLLGLLFLAGFIQKATDPAPVQAMLDGIGLPSALVWPVAGLNLMAAWGLIFGPHVRWWALGMAAYCVATSWFHWQLRADPWQVSIMVKNWAVAGGLLVLAAHGPGRYVLWRATTCQSSRSP